MIGRNHLITGATGFLLIGDPTLSLIGEHLSFPQTLAGTVLCAGAAMLPDYDCPPSTVSRSLGPITEAISHVVAKVSGGHRHGTHSLAAAGLVGLTTSALMASPWKQPAGLMIAFFLVALVVRVLLHKRGLHCALWSIGATVALAQFAPIGSWMIAVIALGYLLHLAGDLITPSGVPLLLPVSKKSFSLPLIGHTGDWREGMIASVCGCFCLYLIFGLIGL
jgi:membrane-bound metal-dependent hydrolase YbcI (DUF457 family)